MTDCGDVYSEGIYDVEADQKEAFTWSVQSVCLVLLGPAWLADGLCFAMLLLRCRYYMAAKAGDPGAMLTVGKRTMAGVGTKQDAKEGQEWCVSICLCACLCLPVRLSSQLSCSCLVPASSLKLPYPASCHVFQDRQGDCQELRPGHARRRGHVLHGPVRLHQGRSQGHRMVFIDCLSLS